MWLYYWRWASRALLADRFFSLVNLLGLSVGLASVAIIFLYVKNEFSHDSWLPKSETLYRIDTVETPPGQSPIEIANAPGPLKPALLKDFPQIAEISRAYSTKTSVVREGRPFSETILAADANFFSLLGLPFAEGSAEGSLRNTGSVALSARMAEKYFGDENALGKRLTILVPEPRDFVVSAVFETIPDNSHMAFDVVIPFDGYFGANSEDIRAIPDAWGGAYFHTYARLKDDAKLSEIEQALPAFIDRTLPRWLTDLLNTAPHNFYQFRFVPVRDLHFDGAATGAMKPGTSRTAVLAVATVALLILAIASINFANLTIARTSLRAKEVALRKVVGANRVQILIQFLSEAGLLVLCSGLVALALVELALPYVGTLFGLASAFSGPDQWQLWAALAGLILATALASGLYPSLVISRIRPAFVLTRGLAQGGGGAVRTTLVVIQFAISIGLIVTTITMLLQTRFTQSADLGFDRENVLVVRLPEGEQQPALARSFKDTLARNPEVVGVTLSSAVPSDVSEDNIAIRIPGAAKPLSLGLHTVDPQFFETYGVKLLSGRISMMQLADGAPGAEQAAPVVVNETALKPLAIASPDEAIGEIIRTEGAAYTIVGVVPDLHFRSLHQPVREEMYVFDEAPGGMVSIRYRTSDPTRLIASVDQAWRERVSDRPVDRVFLDEAMDALYQRERTQGALLSIFSGIAILLSCLGLLAMAAFSLQRRTKEIAVRKVHGARTWDVARLLLWDMSKPVLLANLIAWPLAWLVVRDWLNSFAYRIDLPVSAFLFAGLGTLLIALLAVAAHTFKVARSHPALALKHE